MAKPKKETTEKQPKFTTQGVKDWGLKLYHTFSTFAAEVIIAAFAIKGIMSVIHTEKTLQTVIAVVFVFALLAVKFSNRK